MTSRLFTFFAMISLAVAVGCVALWVFSYSAAPTFTQVGTDRTFSRQIAISRGGVLLMSRQYPSVAYGTAGLNFNTSAPADLNGENNWNSFAVRFRRAGFASYALTTPRFSMAAFVFPLWLVLLLTVPLPGVWMWPRSEA